MNLNSIDISVVESLNRWGTTHATFLKILSEDSVYLIMAVSILWLVIRTLNHHKPIRNFGRFSVDLIKSGILLFAIPVGLATLISEVISKFYVRERPFVVLNSVKLLIPHPADGGMPSHHMVFMIALTCMIYFFDRKISALLLLLAITSGVARVATGVHYPSDVIAGAMLGFAIAFTYYRVFQARLKPYQG